MQTVTLLVDPKGAETLALGMSEGKIHLTLRNPDDSDTLSLAAINTRQILGGAAAPAPSARPAARPAARRAEPAKPTQPVVAPPPPPYKPSVIKAGKITNQEPTQK
jgi:Flp pilus assembly protein CpaB